MPKVTVAIAMFVVSAISATAAHAATTSPWTGPYVGGFIAGKSAVFRGGTQVNPSQNDYFLPTSFPAIASASAFHRTSNATNGDLVAGFNKDFGALGRGRLIIGLEGEIESGHLAVASAVTATYPCCADLTYSITQSVRLRGQTAVRLRVGRATGHHMIYVTAGLAAAKARLDAHLNDDLQANETVGGSASKTLTGWSTGIGGEFRFARSWTFRAEYVLADLGKLTATGKAIVPGSIVLNLEGQPFSGALIHTASVRTSTVRVGFIYHM